jgi:hypothetical protein
MGSSSRLLDGDSPSTAWKWFRDRQQWAGGAIVDQQVSDVMSVREGDNQNEAMGTFICFGFLAGRAFRHTATGGTSDYGEWCAKRAPLQPPHHWGGQSQEPAHDGNLRIPLIVISDSGGS